MFANAIKTVAVTSVVYIMHKFVNIYALNFIGAFINKVADM